MVKLTKMFIVSAALLCASQVNATALFTDAGFGAGDSTVTFDEVALAAGTAVTNQYSAQGVVFSGFWYASGNPGPYSANPGFAGSYLDTFTGAGSHSSVYNIIFNDDVDAAGSYWEFNISAPAATFEAFLNGALVESFNYDNVDCCSSTQFIGFAGIIFDEIRISNITFADFIMDTLHFSPALHQVPAPGSLALLGLGLLASGFARRRAKA